MQVKAVTSQNNQLSFGAIYNVSKVKFTQKQNEVIDDIVKTLRKPMLRFRNKTSENYYKLKKNIDFSIDNCNRNEDSVYFEGWYNTTKTEDELIYEKPFLIGVYSPAHKFKVSDIKKGLNGDGGVSLAQIIAIPAIIIAGLFGVNAIEKTQETTKPLIENVDSIVNKAKAVKPILEDSFKLGKKVIRK